MGRLLTDTDYLRVIQDANLQQIIEENTQILKDMEQAAQSEMTSYLKQRYDTDRIFYGTDSASPFNLSAVYKGLNLVQYSEAAYSALTTYTTGQRVVYQNKIYSSIAGNVPGAWNASQWTYVCEDKQFFYVTLPEDEYNHETTYIAGAQVWYKDYVYTADRAVKGIVPTTQGYWTQGSQYTITGQYPTNTQYWTAGDNRNQQIVMHLMDITLYHLHSRINPRNVPDLRKERYDGNSPNQSGGAIAFLKRVGKGDVSLDCPTLIPDQGLSIRWGNSDGTIERTTNMY